MATAPSGLITGDEATDTILSNQRVIDMSNVIAELEPDNAPFVALMGKLGKGTLRSPKKEWLESFSMPRFTTLTASATSAATSFAIASATSGYFRVGDGVRVTETGEFVEVTAVNSATLGVTRGIQEGSIGVPAAAGTSATSAAGLYIVNNANAEGAGKRVIKAALLSAVYNYAQIIRTPYGATETTIWSDMYGQYDNEKTRLQHNAGLEHDRQVEATFFWGARKQDTSTAGSPKRWCGGLFEFISTNVTPVGGLLTRSAWETFLRSGFRYGSAEKWFFCSPLVMAALDGFVWNTSATSNGNAQRQNVPIGGNDIGVAITRYECSQGTVNIVRKRHWNDSADLRGAGFLVDMANVKEFTAPGRDARMKEPIQANDVDAIEGDFLSEVTLEIRQEATHSRMSGVTG